MLSMALYIPHYREHVDFIVSSYAADIQSIRICLVGIYILPCGDTLPLPRCTHLLLEILVYIGIRSLNAHRTDIAVKYNMQSRSGIGMVLQLLRRVVP